MNEHSFILNHSPQDGKRFGDRWTGLGMGPSGGLRATKNGVFKIASSGHDPADRRYRVAALKARTDSRRFEGDTIQKALLHILLSPKPPTEDLMAGLFDGRQ